MKGIVFSEFNEMVEDKFSPETADKIIVEADLASGGAYTSVGTYDHRELLTLVTLLSAETGIDVATLVKTFGKYLAGRFSKLYPVFFEGVDGTLDFLATIEEHVHVEVKKLYPDAELPNFRTTRGEDRQMTMYYESRRPFADLAEGLISGCAEHFAEKVSVTRLDDNEGDNFRTTFHLSLQR